MVTFATVYYNWISFFAISDLSLSVGFVKVVLLVDKSIMTFLFLVLVIIFP